MGYEIPQQLKHKEKIIFNLTFTQLGYIIIFSIPVLILFKQSYSFTKFILLSSPFIILAVGFMFFNLSNTINNLVQYFKFKTIKRNEIRIEKILPIRKILNDTIYTKHGNVAILEIQPINFSIRNDEDKNTIIKGFQKFLNSLDFPVQFVITTHNLSIKGYLKKLEKKTDDKELFHDFSSFILKLIEDKEIRNRKFYLAILEKSSLDIQCNVCIERFKRFGIISSRLKTKEILKDIHLFFNNEFDPRPEGKFENPLHYILGPNYIDENYNYFKLNEKYSRIITTNGYPRIVEQGFLDRIISTNDDFDISIHIEPFSINSTLLMLNGELQKQRADLYSEEMKGSVNPSLEIKYNDTRKVLDNLQKGEERLFNVSLTINCKASSKEHLDYLTKKVEAELNSIMIQPKVPYFKQLKGYQTLIPLAQNKLKDERNITTNALSAFFPLTSPFLAMEESGIFLGLNKNKIPIIRDIYNLSNANGIVLATSGSGKSYFTKLLILRHLLQNTKVIIIDPQGEYSSLTKYSKGELIEISRDSKTIINPLDLMGHDYMEKRLSLMDVFKIMFGELSEIQKAILDKALTNTYARFGITKGKSKGKSMPILGDLYQELEYLSSKANRIEKTTYQALLNRLFMYTEGVFSFMNRQTQLNFNSNFVCFNIGDMPKQIKPLVMFLILEFVYTKMKSDKERKLLVIDEAWSLLSKTEEASYIFEIVKTCRKYNLGLLLITQDVEDLLSSRAGAAVLSNSSYTLLLRQKPSVISSLMKTFNLSSNEKDYILTAAKGRGILILENEHQEIEVVASPKEDRIITTNADELNGEYKLSKIKSKNKVTLDLNRGYYSGSVLTKEEKNFIGLNGYKVSKLVPIGKTHYEEFWVKTNKVESIEHTFLVHNIKNVLGKYVKEVKVNVVRDVDLMVLNKKDEEIAIEVETGIGFNFHKGRILNKFRDVCNRYERVIVILTNSKLKPRYENLLKDLNLRIISRKELLDLFEVKK
jgi:type IV secretory pathway VirB4 component